MFVDASPARAAAVFFAFATLGVAGIASADGSVATRVEYKAPAGCPSSSEFEKRLHARAPRVRLVSGGAAARILHVEISRRPDGHYGSLRITDPGGAERRRSLKASRCEDTLDGLALIAAVALDSDAAGDLLPAEAEGPGALSAQPEPPPPPRTEQPSTPPPVVAHPADPIPNAAAGAEPDLRTAGTGPKTSSWNVFAGVGGGGLFGQAPGTLAVFMLFAGAEWLGSPWWSPQIRAAIVQSAEGEFDEPYGVVHFGVTLGMIEACPFRFGPEALGIRPCFAGTGGVTRVSGTQTMNAESHTLWNWHLGASILASIHLAKEFSVGAHAGILGALRQDHYLFIPIVVYSDPAVSGFAQAELSVAFQ